MKKISTFIIFCTTFLGAFSAPLLAVNHQTYTEAGKRFYDSLYSIHQQGMSEVAMEYAKTFAHFECFNDADKVHFLVLWMNIAIKIDNQEERNQADKELKILIQSSEDAFWEFRSYYDC